MIHQATFAISIAFVNMDTGCTSIIFSARLYMASVADFAWMVIADAITCMFAAFTFYAYTVTNMSSPFV